MFNWIKKKSVQVQKREAETFLNNIKSMDSEELGPLIVLVLDQRNNLLETGMDLMRPFECVEIKPDFSFLLSSALKERQKSGDYILVAAGMVWLHTVRAACSPELRQVARDIWGELERGRPHINTASIQMFATGSFHHIITNSDFRFPEGFTPTPL